LRENVSTIKKNTEILLKTSWAGGLEVNAEETKYMFMFSHQSTGQSHGSQYILRACG